MFFSMGEFCTHGKKWFSYGNKIRDNIFFVAATKNFAAATKRFVDRAKHFVVVTKYFCYPYFNKWFCWYNKTFYSVQLGWKGICSQVLIWFSFFG